MKQDGITSDSDNVFPVLQKPQTKAERASWPVLTETLDYGGLELGSWWQMSVKKLSSKHTAHYHNKVGSWEAWTGQTKQCRPALWVNIVYQVCVSTVWTIKQCGPRVTPSSVTQQQMLRKVNRCHTEEFPPPPPLKEARTQTSMFGVCEVKAHDFLKKSPEVENVSSVALPAQLKTIQKRVEFIKTHVFLILLWPSSCHPGGSGGHLCSKCQMIGSNFFHGENILEHRSVPKTEE